MQPRSDRVFVGTFGDAYTLVYRAAVSLAIGRPLWSKAIESTSSTTLARID